MNDSKQCVGGCEAQSVWFVSSIVPFGKGVSIRDKGSNSERVFVQEVGCGHVGMQCRPGVRARAW
eukprot:4575668-Amphidinium_carterae.1